MNLTTGAKFTAFIWEALPIPDSVIKRVNHIGRNEPRDLVFFDRTGKRVLEDDAEITGVEGETTTPQSNSEVNITDDLDIQEELEDIALQEQAEQPLENPDTVVVETVPEPELTQEPEIISDMSDTDPVSDPEPEPTVQVETVEEAPPVESTGVRRSGRNRTQYKELYTPSFTGKR